jgi:hypothetical protein
VFPQPVSTHPDVLLLAAVPWAELSATWWRVAGRHPVGDPMRQSCYDVVVQRVRLGLWHRTQTIYPSRFCGVDGAVQRTQRVLPPDRRDAVIAA